MTLGADLIRVGAESRARGKTIFGADLKVSGDLVLVCLRADQAPARIEALEIGDALKVPGVIGIFTAKDIPGENRLGIIASTRDHEFLAAELVRHRGQALALVAAESEEAARAGLRAITVRLRPVAGVFDPTQALIPGAPLVHPESKTDNVLYTRNIRKGDVDSALAKSAVIHEAEYTTSFVEHSALETEGGRAWIEENRLVIMASTQNPHYDRSEVARFLGLKVDQVRVIQAETGGGFGGKLDVSVQPYLGLAAWLLKRPVSMIYTREETFLATGKRHPFKIHCISGADQQGCLTAIKAELLGDTGAFASYGLAVAIRAAIHATGPYYVPNVLINCRLAYTNNPWTGAMRGFGVPQAALAHEGQMDALADKLGLDRLEFRLINVLRPGLSTATGQVLTGGVGIAQCLERIRPRYREWLSQVGPDQGIGLGAMFYGIGNTGVSNPSSAQIEWTKEGRIVLFTGAAEIGQGSDTTLRQLAATRLNLDPERIELVRADTDRTTDAGASSASRQTFISGMAVVNAAEDLENIILKEAEELLEIHRADLALDGEEIRIKGSPSRSLPVSDLVRRLADQGVIVRGQGSFDPETTNLDPKTGQGKPYAAYAYAAQTAWVEVDRASGEVTVKRVAAAHDVGRAINRRLVAGQIHSGVIMGLGMALMEEYIPGKTSSFADYHLPTMMDLPIIEPIIVEEPEPSGPYGAKGVGEPALIPTVPAIASAVGRALGRPMNHLPISLERVMAASIGDRG